MSTYTMGFGLLSRLGTSTNLQQSVRYKPSIFERFDRFGILSSVVHFLASRKIKLAVKSGIDLSFLQLSNLRS